LDIPDESQIIEFLKEFKDIVANGRGLDVIPRIINRQALNELGLTAKIRKNEILNLTHRDYSKGPKPDYDRPGEVWEFGKHIGENDVYIKLKIAKEGSIKIAKCISFHKAQHPITYPLKE
jgi:hypothetical protein